MEFNYIANTLFNMTAKEKHKFSEYIHTYIGRLISANYIEIFRLMKRFVGQSFHKSYICTIIAERRKSAPKTINQKHYIH